MARLIDADALNDNFKKTKIIEVFPNWKEMNPGTRSAVIRLTEKYREIILNAKTVDAEVVVLCEKCKHALWDEENEMWKCVESAEYDEEAGEWYGFYEYHNGDFFCADGESRTDG